MIIAAKKAGRCTSGYELGQGTVIHAVEGELNSWNEIYGKALCGTEPGRRSVGWTVMQEKPVTCQKCLKKIALKEQS